LRPQSPTIAEEQNLIKESLKDALKDSDDDSDGKMWGGLFQKRHKTQADVVCMVLYGVHVNIEFSVELQWAILRVFLDSLMSQTELLSLGFAVRGPEVGWPRLH
jgi:hypothetical protein